MPQPIPSEVLKYVRETEKLSQASLASRMQTVASVLSKLEKADDAEPEIAERYLSAIGTPLANEVLEFYNRDWKHSAPPSYLHPNREELWAIDHSLSQLSEFERSPRNDPILRAPIDLLRAELSVAANYLQRRDHTVAWIGDIGVGKTTALAHAAGLLVGDGRSQRKPAFPVGSGRTTVCETAIRVAPTFGIAVDALDDDEVVRLTRDLVTSVAPDASGVGIPSEVARVLRNMSGMKTSTVEIGEDEFQSIDPIADLLEGGLSIDQAVDWLVSAMRLPERRERQLVLPEGSEDGLSWVSKTVSHINNGMDERFGVPRRINVLMPSSNLSADGQILSVIDTRGVEQVTQREDLTALRDDPRTLAVLCTKFPDAPNASVQRHLQDTQEAGSDAAARKRQCILVLPRGDEALQVPGFDEPISSRAQGYSIRRKDVAQALVKATLPATPTYFFDAHNDDADRVWTSLRGQIAEMRAVYADRVSAASAGVQNLIQNVDVVKTAEARRGIQHSVDRLLEDVAPMPTTVRPPHQNLIDQLATAHHSSIAASIVRGGDWSNFPVTHILGSGVRIDANLRIADHISRINHRLDDFENEYGELEDVVQSLKAVRTLVAEGRQEFLASCLTIGRDAYGNLLSAERDVWKQAIARYGEGSGYKRDLAGIWREFFESPIPASTVKSINSRLRKSWETHVLVPLKRATRADAAEG
ncbi:helix-turn-helix domain-containing protein [Rhizobium leguminosarum]|uniref:helix-turn-helix domain-containing protein n=1 Tax=Rhizobium leguminosarum TaxID=384 RepID=UPI0010303B53|nr:helix-turn-helix transcriptional regulator [Rhizobium leguminosarum]TAY10404.1 XRE family transcriptional regulator [Rhizobium leguminosarum]